MSKSIQIFLIFIFCWIPEICNSQSWFWIEFADKTGSQYSISKPEEFLSERAIQRRIRQNIPIDETDLPVSKVYIDSIINTGVEHIHSSKWLNGITVRAENDT